MADTDLIIVPKETALTVFSADNGLEPFMAKIRAEIDAFVPDISTKKGRDAVASIAFKVAKSKTYLDGVGKDLVAELKELPKKIDASRKEMRDTLDAWKDEVRKPLTEWEEEEQARIELHKAGIDGIKSQADNLGDLSSDAIRGRIDLLSGTIVNAAYQEFEAEAHRAKTAALESLQTALAAREKYEAEQRELERHRKEAAEREQKEREERIAREAAEKATREAAELAARQAAEIELKAKAEREEAIRREAQAKAESDRRELEQKLALERAEREKADALLAVERAQKDAERKAQEAVEAEQRRVAAESQRLADETAAREKDRAHKTATNRSAMKAFIDGGLSEECAKLAVTLIAKRAIPGISIAY